MLHFYYQNVSVKDLVFKRMRYKYFVAGGELVSLLLEMVFLYAVCHHCARLNLVKDSIMKCLRVWTGRKLPRFDSCLHILIGCAALDNLLNVLEPQFAHP